MSDKIVHLTDESFKTEVLESTRPVLVDFWAPWCGPCRMVAPILDEVAEELDDVKICKMNIDEQQSVALEYKVMSIPTFMVFKDGKLVKQHIGAIAKDNLKSFISQALS